MTTDTNQQKHTLLTPLRRLAPVRKLAYWEHLRIAERQATKLHQLLDQDAPGVKLDWLSGSTTDNITVVMQPRWRMEGLAGITTLKDGQWVIGVNKGDPHARRRFTLMHEFKHALDGQTDTVTYQGISINQRELIADYFAACYLMPKLLIRRAWTSGIQDPEALAGMFKVSVAAMTARLHYLQYLDTEPDRTITSYFRRNRVLLSDNKVAHWPVGQMVA